MIKEIFTNKWLYISLATIGVFWFIASRPVSSNVETTGDMIQTGGISAASLAPGLSGGGSPALDMGEMFRQLTAQAHEQATVSKAAVATTTNLDNLVNFFKNIKTGESANFSYNELGQVTGFSKNNAETALANNATVIGAKAQAIADTTSAKAGVEVQDIKEGGQQAAALLSAQKAANRFARKVNKKAKLPFPAAGL